MAQKQKLCFVTIGATADFKALVHATLQESFLRALRNAGYTHLRLQYGKIGKEILNNTFGLSEEGTRRVCGIEVSGFDFNPSGLAGDMAKARGGKDNKGLEGVVISHAGTVLPTVHHISSV